MTSYNFTEFKAVGKPVTLTEAATRGIQKKKGVIKNVAKFAKK